MNPSNMETLSLTEQACQEVDRWRNQLPAVEFVHKYLINLQDKAVVLRKQFRQTTRLFEEAITYLKLPSADIHCLDKETCCNLLRTFGEVTSRVNIHAALLSGQQIWPSRIHLKELCQSPNPNEEVFLDDWYDHIHLKLKYFAGYYFTVLLDGHKRLRTLVSKGKVQLAQLKLLKIVLEKSMNLLVLKRADLPRVDKKECCRLVKIIKLFVIGALARNYAGGNMEQVWPCKNLIAISRLLKHLNLNGEANQVGPPLEVRAESSGQCPPRGRGVAAYWQHQEYKLIQTVRKKYSWILDEAYNKDYTGVMCNNLARTSDKYVSKWLEFLATPWAEFVSLSPKKCLDRVKFIKIFIFLTKDNVSAISANQSSLQQQAPGSSPNWRDWVYEEIRGMRKKYSYELDKEVLRTRRLVCLQNSGQVKKRKACSNILLEESLDFVGYARADLALVSMEESLDRLARVLSYLKCSRKFDSAEAYEKFLESCGDSNYQIWPERSPYWRDYVYEEVKSKKTKFLHEFAVPCRELYQLKFQTPELATESSKLKELEYSLDRAARFFTMKRYDMALLLSEKEYDESVVSINQDIVNAKDILTNLEETIGKKAFYPSDISRILLERRI